MKVVKLNQKPLRGVENILRNGGVVICPTDTVYGFLADAANKIAVKKIFKFKKRPKSKPLAVFIKDIKMAKELAEINKEQEKELKKHWPGKFTFILKAKKGRTIGLRVPKNKLIIDIIKKIGPLAQTSVNISGQPELNKISDIVKTFEKSKTQPDLIIDGGSLPKRKPSTIIDLTKNNIKIIR
jgi:L-threonylcarbamoyladenylate synthase